MTDSENTEAVEIDSDEQQELAEEKQPQPVKTNKKNKQNKQAQAQAAKQARAAKEAKDTYRFNYQLTLAEHFKENCRMFYKRTFTRVILALVLLVDAYFIYQLSQAGAEAGRASTIMMAVILTAFVVFIYPVTLYFDSRHMIKKDVIWSHEVCCTFQKQFLKIQAGKEHFTLRLSELLEVLEKPESFLLLVKKQQSMIIPKRAMTEEQIVAFRAYLRESVLNSRLKLQG